MIVSLCRQTSDCLLSPSLGKVSLNDITAGGGVLFHSPVGALASRLSWTDSVGRFHKMSAQAVGQAVGANPCCILIPCHRVIASSGAIGGYAHGQVIKKALLDFESVGAEAIWR